MRPSLAAVLVAATVASSAFAADEAGRAGKARAASAASTITLGYAPPTSFTGRVSSPEKSCEPKRRVSLLYFESEADPSSDQVGSTKTDGSGRWSIAHDPPPEGGVYRANVAKRKVNVDGDPFRCKPKRSAPLTIDPEEFQLAISKSGAGLGSVTSSPAGIDCGSDCDEEYAFEAQVTLTASPDSGSIFAGWSGGSCTGLGTCEVTMSQARSVTANFGIEEFQLTVARAGAGSGSVSSSPTGISCGADCGERYNTGTQVTLTASPDSGSTFAGWSGEGCSGAGTCVVTMDQARSVTASFALEASPCSDNGVDNVPGGATTMSSVGGDAGSDVSEMNDRTLCAGDVDWYRITVTDVNLTCFPNTSEDFSVRFTLDPAAVSAEADGNLDLYVYPDSPTNPPGSSTMPGTSVDSVRYEFDGVCGSNDDKVFFAKVVGAAAGATNSYSLSAAGNVP